MYWRLLNAVGARAIAGFITVILSGSEESHATGYEILRYRSE
ncbi:MAG: hypothetical protein ACXWOX_12280 [Ktedonobacteraceae bacterium]